MPIRRTTVGASATGARTALIAIAADALGTDTERFQIRIAGTARPALG
jgi:hypothetical protein